MPTPEEEQPVISPRLFVAFVRGQATPRDMRRIRKALADPQSSLNRWLEVVQTLEPQQVVQHSAEIRPSGWPKSHPFHSEAYKRFRALADYLHAWAREAHQPTSGIVHERDRIGEAVLQAAWGDSPVLAENRTVEQWEEGYRSATDFLQRNHAELFGQFKEHIAAADRAHRRSGGIA